MNHAALRVRSIALTLACTLALAGCSDDTSDGVSGDAACDASIALSGGVVTEVGGESDIACGTQLSSDVGVEIGFLVLEGAVDSVTLRIPDVKKGELGEFDAVVTIESPAGSNETSACRASVTEHSLVGPSELGDSYQLRGSVSCTAAAESAEEAPAITIERFDFAAQVSWL